MLINLRNALMTGKRLPYDNEVEYIESTGTQYIDSGIAPNYYTKVSCAFSADFHDNDRVFGARGRNNGDRQFECIAYDTSQYGFIFRFGNSPNYTFKPSDFTQTFSITMDSSGVVINGTTVAFSQTSQFETPCNLLLFAGNFNGSPGSYSSAKINSCQIWQNGVLVRDFIPVRKGTVGYLYDRVSGKLFGNAGTGDFVLGPDVVPVEYIESHGVEWIDTGIIPDDSTGVEVVHTICPDNGTDNIIFGVRQDSGDTRYWIDVDWTSFDSIGWGFNTYSDRSDRFELASSDVGRVVTNSLNYMNDRAGKIDGVAYDSSLQSKTLATISRSIYLFGANNKGEVGVMGKFKVYSAKISKGQTLANKFLPVRVGTGTTWEGAMMDTLTRRIYRNAGTGVFAYGNDLKYPIPAS